MAERLMHELLPIQKVGILLWNRSRDLGVTKVMNGHIKKVEIAFNSIYKLQSVKNIIENTDPHFRAGSYLIFNPHVRPERSLCWLSAQDSELRLGGMDELEKWNYDTFMDSHYFINIPYKGKTKGVVWGCFDESGTLFV